MKTGEKMKRITFFSAFVMCIALFFSCTSSKPAPEQSGTSVWKISRNGSTLFLGGSIHLLRDSDFPLPKEFDLAFSQSSVLVLEADVEQMGKEEIVNDLMSKMLLDDGQNLQAILDKETYELLAAKVDEYGLSIEAVSNLKPSMVMMFLSVLQIQELGFTQEGIDFYFMEKAKNEKKPIKFLESVESQIDIIVSMGDGYENDYIRYSLKDMDDTETALAEILKSWRSGDSASSELSMESMKEEWPLIYKSLITNRHDAWMPQIEEYLDSGEVFFVVTGFLHMHGPDGLLQQLKSRGCVIEQF